MSRSARRPGTCGSTRSDTNECTPILNTSFGRFGGLGRAKDRDRRTSVKIVERILDDREPKMGMPAGSVRLLIALESPKGLFNAYAIATSSPRVIGLLFGAEEAEN